jgi:hypothetical protein
VVLLKTTSLRDFQSLQSKRMMIDLEAFWRWGGTSHGSRFEPRVEFLIRPWDTCLEASHRYQGYVFFLLSGLACRQHFKPADVHVLLSKKLNLDRIYVNYRVAEREA